MGRWNGPDTDLLLVVAYDCNATDLWTLLLPPNGQRWPEERGQSILSSSPGKWSKQFNKKKPSKVLRVDWDGDRLSPDCVKNWKKPTWFPRSNLFRNHVVIQHNINLWIIQLWWFFQPRACYQSLSVVVVGSSQQLPIWSSRPFVVVVEKAETVNTQHRRLFCHNLSSSFLKAARTC